MMVDQADTAGSQALELALDIVDVVGDVMEPGALSGQEAAHGALVGERPQQLDVALTYIEQDPLDALFGHRLAVNHRQAERVTVKGERRLQVLDDNPDVIDAPEHGDQDTRGLRKLGRARRPLRGEDRRGRELRS